MLKKLNNYLFCFSINNIQIYSRLIALTGILNLVLIYPDYVLLYSDINFIPQEYIKSVTSANNITFYKLNNYLIDININYNIFIILIISLYLYSLLSLLFDFSFKFLCSIIVLVVHVLMTNSNVVFSYGADFFLNFLFFINVLFSYSFKDSKILHSFALRLTQIHLCIVYFFAGFGKCFGIDWFNGDAFIKISKLYMTRHLVFDALPLFVFIILGIAVVLMQLFYFALINNNYTRRITFYFIILMHLAIAISMKFYTFGLVMIILNVVAWGNYYHDLKIIKLFKKVPHVRIIEDKL